MDTIYFIYVNADSNEGRGPMVMLNDVGFFDNEDEAWVYANTLTGVQGRKPPSGGWREAGAFGDVTVKSFERYDPVIDNQIRDLEDEIRYRQEKLDKLRVQRGL